MKAIAVTSLLCVGLLIMVVGGFTMRQILTVLVLDYPALTIYALLAFNALMFGANAYAITKKVYFSSKKLVR